MDNYRPPAPNSRVKVCVTQDQDFHDQIGSHQWFDLVNPEKVLTNSVFLLFHILQKKKKTFTPPCVSAPAYHQVCQ